MQITEQDKIRFWSKVKTGNTRICWEWQGKVGMRSTSGYGVMKALKAHRISYFLNRGEIPKGLSVLHKCDNRKCVNPSHLFLGTNADNVRDRHQKGRTSHKSRNVGESHGRSKLTDEQVIEIRKRWNRGEKQRRMEEEFGLKRGSLWPVVHGVNYNHFNR